MIIHDIPDSEYEDAGYYNFGDEIYAEMHINPPLEDIEWEFSQKGNGITYSDMKKRIALGEEFELYEISEGEHITREQSFAKIVSVGGKNKIAYNENGEIFYLTILWKDSEENIETQILPYRILTENEVDNTSGTENMLSGFREPVSEPERIIFREVYGEYGFFTEEEMENAGLILDVFSEPGVIAVNQKNVSEINIERIANSEAWLLPPDTTPKMEDETYEEWLDRIYAETKYAGYKLSHHTGVSYTSENPEKIENVVSGSRFFSVSEDYHTLATNIMETTVSEVGETTVWTTKDDTKDVVMIVDWYLEDVDENPEAKPAKREYLCTRVNPFVYYKSEEIIAGGYCGGKDNYTSVIWNLDKNGVLSISGKGPMADYSGRIFLQETKSWVIKAPWGEFADKCKTLVIGEGITAVGEQAFAGMTGLSGGLIIPETVTEIKYDAFLACGFDCSLTIPGNVKTIGESAFADWQGGNPGELLIEEGLEHLGSGAFDGGKFTSASLPSTLRDMQGSAFGRCPVLEKVSISEKNRDLCIVDDVLYTKDMKILVEVLGKRNGKFTVPDEVEIIGVGAFQMSNIESVTLPVTVKTIKRAAFHGFDGEVHIMGKLDEIEDFAFYPGEGMEIAVCFHEEPPAKVNGASLDNPSFCNYRGNVRICANEAHSGSWNLDLNGKWNGYEIKFSEI